MSRRFQWSLLLAGVCCQCMNLAFGQEAKETDSQSPNKPANESATPKKTNPIFKELRTLDRKGPTPIGNFLVFSADGKFALSSGDDGIILSDAKTWEVMHRFQGHDGLPATALAVSSDGKRFASGGYDGRVCIWDIESRQELVKFEGHRTGETFEFEGKKLELHSPDRLVFSPDNKQVLSSSHAHAWLWDAATAETLHPMIPQGYSLSRAVYSRDGRWILASLYEAGEGTYELAVLDPTTGKEVRRLAGKFKGDHWIENLAVTSTGKHVVACCRDATIRIWEIESGKEIKRMSVATKNPLSGLALSRDGRRAITWDQKLEEKWTTERFDLGGGQFEIKATSSKQPAGDATVHLWDVKTGKRLGSKIHAGDLHTVGFTPDGRHLLLGSEKEVLEWEVVTTSDTVPGK